MTKFFPLIMLVCGVALVFVAGPRLTTDTAAVIIGVVVGIVASVPVSLLLIALLSRRPASYARSAPAALGPARSPVTPPAPPAAPVSLAAPRLGPPPVAPDKVRAHLGSDLDGVPLDLDFGGTDAAGNLLVVNAPDVYYTIGAAAEQAGWRVEPVSTPAALAAWAHICRRDALPDGQPPVVLALEDLADLLTDDRRQCVETNRRLAYLAMHGPAVGLHVLAGAKCAEILPALDLTPWPVRITGPYQDAATLAANLDLTCDQAAELLADDASAHWLCARSSIWIGFHPTGGA